MVRDKRRKDETDERVCCFAAGMNVYNFSYKLQPPTLSSADSIDSTSISAPRPLSGLLRPQVLAADSGYRAMGESMGDYELGAVAQASLETPGEASSHAAVRPGGRANKRRPRNGALPGVERNSDGAIYVPPSESSRRQRPRARRQKYGSRRRPLPPVSRNSVGDVVVCALRPPTEPDQPDSELTPSSLIFEQIDDIYGRRRTSRRVPQYFGDVRPRLGTTASADDREQLVNEEDSVYQSAFTSRHTQPTALSRICGRTVC